MPVAPLGDSLAAAKPAGRAVGIGHTTGTPRSRGFLIFEISPVGRSGPIVGQAPDLVARPPTGQAPELLRGAWRKVFWQCDRRASIGRWPLRSGSEARPETGPGYQTGVIVMRQNPLALYRDHVPAESATVARLTTEQAS